MNEFQRMLDEKLKSAVIETPPEENPSVEYDILKEIRDEIIEIRKSKQISQKKLADKTGISQANISKIENGHYIPSILILKRIADGLDKRLVVTFLNIEEEFFW